MKEVIIQNFTIKYSDKGFQIKNSYLITSKQKMFLILDIFLNATEFKINRNIDDLIAEWKFHNLLYNLYLFRKHTKDCDFDTNESKIRLFIYKLFNYFI